MTIHLECALPRTSCNQPGRRAGKALIPFGIVPPLFGFAPGGVCLAKVCYQTRGALLPHLFTLTCLRPKASAGGLFLWHFPWGCPRRTLSGTVFPWSPDFPPPRVFRHCARAAIQPTGNRGVRRAAADGQPSLEIAWPPHHLWRGPEGGLSSHD